MHTEDLHIK